MKDFDQSDFDQFIANNGQLEALTVVRCDGFKLKFLQRMNNRMKQLNSLKLDTDDYDANVFQRDETINLENLESLKLTVGCTITKACGK